MWFFRLIRFNHDTALGCAAGEVGPEDFAESMRIVFPMPGFVLVGTPAKFLAAQEQPLVDGRFAHADEFGHGTSGESLEVNIVAVAHLKVDREAEGMRG